MNQLLSIALGGAFGAVFRFVIAHRIDQFTKVGFPYGILVVNVLGCLVVGLLSTLFLDRLAVSAIWRAGILIGFLGGFTSFATFSLDTFSLLEQGAYVAATLNILLNNGLCIFATMAGVYAGRLL